MRLTAFATVPNPPLLRPAAARRAWMDETVSRFSYRCLPLTIANQHGWEVLCPVGFEAVWQGGRGREAITILRRRGDGPLPLSHFGEGVLTFDVGYLFRTDEPCGLYVTGPVNLPKDGVTPLTGVVETSWLPFTFTANWLFTRVGAPVRFEEGEPFCQIFPIDRQLVERVEPEIRDLQSEPELASDYWKWRESRQAFNAALDRPDSEARAAGWQRFYTQGSVLAAPRPAGVEHKTRLFVRSFADRRAGRGGPADGPQDPVSAPPPALDVVVETARAPERASGPRTRRSRSSGLIVYDPDVRVERLEADAIVLMHQRTQRVVRLTRPLYERLQVFARPTAADAVLPANPTLRKTVRGHILQLRDWEFLVDVNEVTPSMAHPSTEPTASIAAATAGARRSPRRKGGL